ncbi:MAG TPA: hypothetical protein ENI23_07010 [bacterium]|nr:hypothetical protein [bacterium]
MVLILVFCKRLIRRGIVHDFSKFGLIEAKEYARLLPMLRDTTYGTDEYKDLLNELNVALIHHYNNNPHHPEHTTQGIRGMSLLDVVEMFIDWQAAIKKHADGDIRKSIEINQTRFSMSDELCQILRNSV